MTTTITKAQAIASTSIPQGGGTFHLDGRQVVSGTAVTVDLLATVPHLTDQVVEHALAKVEQRFEGHPVTNRPHLGTWYDEENGVWEISTTTVLDDREAALIFASVLGERYVYDLDRDECVAVS